tara:strand:+ start:13579 stop:14520 length:942 start_codon:yes stop_codon:yes gene_type:complete
MIELYRGLANTWECDEMGHMNVRFYINRQMEGLQILAPSIGLPQLFRPRSTSTIIPVDQHIRYMKEVHAGKPIYMVGGVLEVSDDEAVIYQELRHSVSHEPAAAFRTRIRHVASKSLKGFPWSETTLEKFEMLRIHDLPEKTAPRSINPDDPVLPSRKISCSIADELGVSPIGRCVVQPSQCDAFGRMLPEFFMGRISDSVPNLLGPWRDEVTKAASTESDQKRTGGAVLEFRMVYRDWPKAGDLIEVRSGLGEVKPKIHSLVHWLLNPLTGKPWITGQAYAVTFDLNTRKVIEANPDHMAMLKKHAGTGLQL